MSKAYVFGKSVAMSHDEAVRKVTEPRIGALLPCNVVVRQDAAGGTFVDIMDPQSVLDLVGRPEIEGIAAEVRAKLERVLASL